MSSVRSVSCYLLISLSLEVQANYQRQVVAEAALIAVAINSTERFDTTVIFVFLKKEGGIVDIDRVDSMAQGGADQHMVDAFPAAFVAIGAFSTMGILMNILHNSMSYLGKNVISM